MTLSFFVYGIVEVSAEGNTCIGDHDTKRKSVRPTMRWNLSVCLARAYNSRGYTLVSQRVAEGSIPSGEPYRQRHQLSLLRRPLAAGDGGGCSAPRYRSAMSARRLPRQAAAAR